MASRKVPRAQLFTTEQAEFLVPTAEVLDAFVESDDQAPGDHWSFGNGPGGLVIVRVRETRPSPSEDQPPERLRP